MTELSGKTAFVTGATGFLGGAIALRLADEGVNVRALARRSGRDQHIRKHPQIEIVQGDIRNPDQMRDFTKGCDYVFHAAAALGGRLQHQYQINVEGTAHVARAAAEAKVQRIIHISTIAVYGYQHRGIITESTPHIPGNVPYNITKSRAEQDLKAIARQAGLSYTINRPGLIYGPRSHAWTVQLFRWAKHKPFPFFGEGQGSIYPIFVDDVVDLLLTQAIHPGADGEAFNCVYQPQPTQREFMSHYMALIGNDEWKSYPKWIVSVFAPILDAGFHLFGNPIDLQEILRMLDSTVIYSMDKSHRLLKWQPVTSIEDGIKRCIPYLKEIGLL